YTHTHTHILTHTLTHTHTHTHNLASYTNVQRSDKKKKHTALLQANMSMHTAAHTHTYKFAYPLSYSHRSDHTFYGSMCGKTSHKTLFGIYAVSTSPACWWEWSLAASRNHLFGLLSCPSLDAP